MASYARAKAELDLARIKLEMADGQCRRAREQQKSENRADLRA